LKWPLAFLVAIYALAVVGLAVFQRRYLYFPDRRLTHPAEAGMSGVEELRLVTDDGERCLSPGIFLRGRDTRSPEDQPDSRASMLSAECERHEALAAQGDKEFDVTTYQACIRGRWHQAPTARRVANVGELPRGRRAPARAPARGGGAIKS
jgi:hypothetical protein